MVIAIGSWSTGCCNWADKLRIADQVAGAAIAALDNTVTYDWRARVNSDRTGRGSYAITPDDTVANLWVAATVIEAATRVRRTVAGDGHICQGWITTIAEVDSSATGCYIPA